jgi:penicillin-binding protein 2B
MKKTRIVKIDIIFLIIVVFVFLCLIIKLVYVGVGNIMVGDQTLSEFAKARDTTKKTIYAKRGSILSRSGEILAKDVNSYTVIAYLSESRTKDPSHPYHVVDKEKTAELLSPLINMKKETILKLLNSITKSCNEDGTCSEIVPYQVELGPGGRGITELVKDQIDDLDLPGIDFLASTKRYYPNGDFASYSLGYAKVNDLGNYTGEMGIELYYNDELTGEDGYIEYQADVEGYQITNTPTIEEKAKPGNDVYLTIDDNIQMFTEQAMAKIEEASPDWATLTVVNAKTGEILGIASTPSFNNNTLEIKSYYDPFTSYEYEPGSTMKIFSFMAAMENGVYDGESTYKSGSLKVDDSTIRDWNRYGWGKISFDNGFMASSNVAASKLALTLGRAKLKDFYNLLGFGTKTGISLPNESAGIINFKYNTEVATASFGQGITVSAVQMVQAFTSLANNGVMIKPYIVSKILDSETGDIILENNRTEVKKVCSEDTVNNLIKLMRGVVDKNSKYGTGSDYYIKGYDLIGKTGTAEIASSSGGYLSGNRNYVKSFVGLFPGEDPEIIVYVAASKLTASSYMKTAVKGLIKDVATYLNIYGKSSGNDNLTYTTQSYINKNTEDVVNSLNDAKMVPIVIGEGTKIINQYPKSNTTLNIRNKIFLLTNSATYKMPNIEGWSRSEVMTFANLIGLKVTFDGYGYVTKYSIAKNSIIDTSNTLEVTLEQKYKETQ